MATLKQVLKLYDCKTFRAFKKSSADKAFKVQYKDSHDKFHSFDVQADTHTALIDELASRKQ